MSTAASSVGPIPTILDFRLTFLWVKTILGIFSNSSRVAAPFTLLRKSNLYRQSFEDILEGKSKLGFEAPWQKYKKQFFWKYYLAGPALDSMSGRQAWEHLVPLRTTFPFAVKAWQHGHVTLEGFCYPYGLALAVTFRVVGSLTLDETVRLAYGIKDGEEKFLVVRGGMQSPRNLEQIVDDAFECMSDAFGIGIAPSEARDVFSIFTVVKAVPMIPFDPGVHRAFQAVTEWSPAPETATLRPIVEVQVPVKGSDAPGSMLLAHRRGRAVWLPGLFAQNKPHKPSLGCYHRNLVFASMQVESLGGLVREVQRVLSDTPLSRLNATLKSCALNAIDRLDELYLGDRDRSYRSSSVMKQIQQNELNELNALRQRLRPGQRNLSSTSDVSAEPGTGKKG